MLAAGTTLGPYKILSPLGAGGMGEVYLAEDSKHHRQVAIKVLTPEIAAAVGSERFLREIEIAAKLTHPHILPVHDSGSADGLLYYVMPFVEGESLRQRLTREKQLPVEDAFRIAREVADALSYAHSRGVVHRDIKPENILLEEGHAVVADFGIARAVAAAGGEALTRTGVVVGTPAYMSPEQASGSSQLDGRSDLYSLGCMLYEMLAGVPPFSGSTAESLAHQHLNVSPRPVTELRPAVPAGVAAALQRALAKTPADRFNPAALFGEALGAATSGAATTSTRPRRHSVATLTALGAAAVVVAVVAALWITRAQRKPTPANGRTDIAVLPFQNLSAEGPSSYFAGGLHEELLTQLAKVAALKVISRTSVMGYADTTKPLKQIAAELGVGSIVEGSVQVAGNRLRVNVQLIDAATDEHLWAERYDRTLDDAFAIQSDVAQRIVAAVGAALASEERLAMTTLPTQNPEAYRLYLQGEEYRHRPGVLRENLESAQQLYERALGLDPGFALAHAELSVVHGRMYWYRYDVSASRAARQRAEAEEALRLAPGLPQAHHAMGLAHYMAERDYASALGEIRIALRGLPNDAKLWWSFGVVSRRAGRWAAAESAYVKAAQLDPRNVETFKDLGGATFQNLRRYPDALRAYDRALELAPDYHDAAVLRAMVFVSWRGDLDSLEAALDHMPDDADLGARGTPTVWRAQLLLWARSPDSLLALTERSAAGIHEWQTGFYPASLYRGWAYQMRRDERRARDVFGGAARTLDAHAGAMSDDWRYHAAHGLALAGQGRQANALAEARWLQGSAFYRRDALQGPHAHEARAWILAQCGQPGAALEEIEWLLTHPGLFSVHLLRLDPRWDPIREHPRFKALLVKYANPEKFSY